MSGRSGERSRAVKINGRILRRRPGCHPLAACPANLRVVGSRAAWNGNSNGLKTELDNIAAIGPFSDFTCLAPGRDGLYDLAELEVRFAKMVDGLCIVRRKCHSPQENLFRDRWLLQSVEVCSPELQQRLDR